MRRSIALLSLIFLALFIAPLSAEEMVSISAAKQVGKPRHWDNVGKVWLTPAQAELLDLAYRTGYADGGRQQALLLQAILMYETRAGASSRIGDTHSPVGKRSYGIMQIKLITAFDVLKRHRQLGQFATEEALIIRLVTDDRFNLQVASRHLLWLRKQSDFTAQAVMAYNTGLSKAKQHWYPQKFSYVRQIQQYLNEVVMPYNRKRGLATDNLVLVE